MAERLVPVDLKKIRITDELFGGYARLISEKVIPYQWDILNDRAEGADPTYCMQNFRIAAGLETSRNMDGHGNLINDLRAM